MINPTFVSKTLGRSRRFIFGIFLVLTHVTSLVHAENMPTKPNVLLIIADDLAKELGCYGEPAVITPHIDQLAKDGVKFSRAYSQGAVCTPSRNSLLTGLSTRSTTIHGKYNVIYPKATSLGRHFRQNGYQTAGFGKIEHTIEYQDVQGWDYREEPRCKAKANKREFYQQDGEGELKQNRHRNITQIYNDKDKTSDALRADRFEKFLKEEWDRTKPFMAAVGFHNPHEPHEVYQRNLDSVDLTKIQLQKDPESASPFNPLAFNFVPWFPEEETQRKMIRSYFAAVNQMDEQVGRLLGFLRDQGIDNHTIVVFISDNGYQHGYRGQWAKHNVYPKVLNLPLIAKVPSLTKAGGEAQGIVEYLDLFPTLVDICALPAVPHRDGKSFKAQLANPQALGKEAAYAEWEIPAKNIKEIQANLPASLKVLAVPEIKGGSHARTVTTEEWCYVEYYGTEVRELFRLKDDPYAYRNVVDQHPEVATQHAALLHKYFPQDLKRIPVEGER